MTKTEQHLQSAEKHLEAVTQKHTPTPCPVFVPPAVTYAQADVLGIPQQLYCSIIKTASQWAQSYDCQICGGNVSLCGASKPALDFGIAGRSGKKTREQQQTIDDLVAALKTKRQPFLDAYNKAVESSNPQDWMNAALMAKQWECDLSAALAKVQS